MAGAPTRFYKEAMIRQRKRHWGLAAGLAMLAGYVDAIGFLRLNGLFVSFMSGNSTQLGVAVAQRAAAGWLAAALVAGFVAGVVLGARVAIAAGIWRKPIVLALVAVLLALAAAAAGAAPGMAWIAAVLLAVAMGAENTVFQREGEVSVGVTYMTGTLVKLGQHLAAAIAGGPRWRWVPYLLLWSGLILGAAIGASLYPVYGMAALWGAVGAAVALVGVARAIGPTVPVVVVQAG